MDVQHTLGKAKALVEGEQFGAAHETLLACIEANPKRWEPCLALAELILNHSANPEKAIVLLEQAIAIKDEDPLIWQRMAEAATDAGHVQRAFQAWQKVLEMNPQFSPAYLSMSELLEAQGYIDEAAAALKEGFKQSQAHAQEADMLRFAFAQHGFFTRHEAPEAALEAMSAALERLPNEPMLYFLKGVCHEGLGHKAEAETAYARALELGGESVTLHREMASYFSRQGDAVKAMTHLVAVLELDAENREAREALAHLLLQTGRYPQALQVLDSILERAPQDLNALLLKADVYERLGEAKLAHTALDAAMDAHGNPVLAYRKALTLPAFLPEAETDREALSQRLWLALKTLSLKPAPIQNPALDLGMMPTRARQLGLWNDALEATWRKSLAGVQYLEDTATPARQAETHGKLKVLVVSRFVNAEYPRATRWLPLLQALPREEMAVTLLNLNERLNLPAGVSLHEADTVLNFPIHAWPEIQAALLEAQADVILYYGHELDITTLALARRRFAPLQIALDATFSLDETALDASFPSGDAAQKLLPALAPMGENTKRFKVDFGANYGYPLLTLPLRPETASAENLNVIAQLLQTHERLQLAILHEAAPELETQMLERFNAVVRNEQMRSRVGWMRLRVTDRLRLLQVSDALLHLGPLMDEATVHTALSYGTPVFVEASTLHEAMQMRWANQPGSSFEGPALDELHDFLIRFSEEEKGYRPPIAEAARTCFSPAYANAQAKALTQLIQHKMPVGVGPSAG